MYILFCDSGRAIRGNDADEFYEVINIDDVGHVNSRAHTRVECLAKLMIEALASLDLW
jgi:hypothetical protein